MTFAAHDDDVLVARDRSGLVDGGRHAVGHEPEPGREPNLGGHFVGDDVARRCGRLGLTWGLPDAVE
jgi:hypothetical protein